MSRYLLLDVGAGTLDVLYVDEAAGLQYKSVVKSPAPYLAEKAAGRKGNLLVTGKEMGGGAISKALIQRARNARVVMTTAAAATVHHDLDRVQSRGIQVIADDEVDGVLGSGEFSCLTLGDLDVNRLRSIVAGFGVPFEFEVVGVCAQDHGVPPSGMSHLDYRHSIFQAALNESPCPHALLYDASEVPHTLSRLTAIAESAQALPAEEVYLMDSGMAAILGASMDPHARSLERIVVLDVATSHTLGASLERGEIAAFFEYHTCDVTVALLESLLVELAEGRLTHGEVLEAGGHGAYSRKAIGFENVEAIVATGPRRGLLADSRLPVTYGAPLGDNMLTGTVGLLAAIRRREGLDHCGWWQQHG
ncbi:DUF1786 family protein [Planctomycetota bacterium]